MKVCVKNVRKFHETLCRVCFILSIDLFNASSVSMISSNPCMRMFVTFHLLSQLGNTLVFLFDLIGRNPRVQAQLYEEAYALAPAGCDLTVEDLRKAKYLRACITESFRYVYLLLLFYSLCSSKFEFA